MSPDTARKLKQLISQYGNAEGAAESAYARDHGVQAERYGNKAAATWKEIVKLIDEEVVR